MPILFVSLQQNYGITEGENGKRALLGRDEQRHAAVAGTGVRHHPGSSTIAVGLWIDRHDHHLLADCHCPAQQRQISYIDNDGRWYHVYDTDGKKITTLSKHSVGELVGWSAEIIVTKSGVWYRVLDPQGKNCKVISTRATN